MKARSVIGAMLGIPPVYHKRSEITLLERKWRMDPKTLAYFLANVHGAVSNLVAGDKVYTLKAELPSEFLAKASPGDSEWWDHESYEKGDEQDDDEHRDT